MKPLNLFRRKPRVLKNVEVSEISAVPSAANPLAKVVLLKRNGDRAMLKTKFDEAARRLARSVKSILDDDDVTDKNAMLGRSFVQCLDHLNSLTGTRTSLNDAAGLLELFKNDSERAEPDLSGTNAGMPKNRRRRRRDDDDENYTQRLSDDADRDERDDENDDATDDERVEKGMRTMESAQLTALFKRHGFETIAKCNIEKPFLSEFEMTEVGKQEAAARGVSFATLYEGSVTLRKAVTSCRDAQWAKAGQGQLMPIMPTQVGGAAARNVDSDEPDAYTKLVAMAEKMRAASPEMTLAQAFERTYTSPEARGLAEQERRDARSRLPTTGGRTAGGWGS
jgi:hypothetical protein